MGERYLVYIFFLFEDGKVSTWVSIQYKQSNKPTTMTERKASSYTSTETTTLPVTAPVKNEKTVTLTIISPYMQSL